MRETSGTWSSSEGGNISKSPEYDLGWQEDLNLVCFVFRGTREMASLEEFKFKYEVW